MNDVQIFLGSVSLVSGLLFVRFNVSLGAGFCRRIGLNRNVGLLGRVPRLREVLCDKADVSRAVWWLGILLAGQGVLFLCVPLK